MIDHSHALPLVAQARQLGISRGSIYYLPRPAADADLTIMRRIDELLLLYPFAGSRTLRDLLRQEGAPIGRLHVATLMKRMRIEAIYRRPTMRFVPAKSVEQLDLQALHRVLERLVGRRTAVINQIRAFLLQRGIVFRAGRQHMARERPCCS